MLTRKISGVAKRIQTRRLQDVSPTTLLGMGHSDQLLLIKKQNTKGLDWKS